MSGRHFLADRDELSGWISFNASQKKGCWGRCGGEGREPGQTQDVGSVLGWAWKVPLPSRIPTRLLVHPQGPPR